MLEHSTYSFLTTQLLGLISLEELFSSFFYSFSKRSTHRLSLIQLWKSALFVFQGQHVSFFCASVIKQQIIITTSRPYCTFKQSLVNTNILCCAYFHAIQVFSYISKNHIRPGKDFGNKHFYINSHSSPLVIKSKSEKRIYNEGSIFRLMHIRWHHPDISTNYHEKITVIQKPRTKTSL